MAGKNNEPLTHIKEFNLQLNKKLKKKNAKKAAIAAKKAALLEERRKKALEAAKIESPDEINQLEPPPEIHALDEAN